MKQKQPNLYHYPPGLSPTSKRLFPSPQELRQGSGGKDGKDFCYEPGEYTAKTVFTYLTSSDPDDFTGRTDISADLVFEIV